jgi:ribosome-associated protein
MIFVTTNISIKPEELLFTATKASGPGGQHVNTANSAVQLKFDAANSPAITRPIMTRLRAAAGSRMSAEGIITIQASGDRSQHRNKAEAQDRLIALIRGASKPPKYRVKTKPTKGSKERRLKSKARASNLKKTRGRVRRED